MRITLIYTFTCLAQAGFIESYLRVMQLFIQIIIFYKEKEKLMNSPAMGDFYAHYLNRKSDDKSGEPSSFMQNYLKDLKTTTLFTSALLGRN